MRSFLAVAALALGVSLFASPSPAGAAEVRMFIRHNVTDYATWRKAYDDFDATRKKMGVIGQAVYQATDNPNDVTVTHDFKTIEAAKAFSESPDLKATMEKAGVSGAPTIWFTVKAGKPKMSKEAKEKAEGQK